MYFTYILYSESTDRYYIGSCEDLEKRLHDHETGRSNYTKQGKPWILRWSCCFSTRREAMAEERRIKAKKSRKYLEYLIASAS